MDWDSAGDDNETRKWQTHFLKAPLKESRAKFDRHPTHFLNAHYVAVDGTDHPIFWFDFDADTFLVALEIEWRAALLATRAE